MSVEPAIHPALSRPSPLRPSRQQERNAPASAAEVRQAQSFLPRAVVRGCREAIQRIAQPAPRSYAVTSTVRGEGRSTVAAGMALVEWLDYERRTVLVDLDLEHPDQHRRFGADEGPGISELVEGRSAAIEDYLQRIVGDVWLLSAGHQCDDAPRTLTRLAQSSILSQLAEWADAVVFDLPPLTGSPSGVEAARLCSNPVLVIRAGVTPLPAVKDASDALTVPPPVILNGARSALPLWIRRSTGDWKP